MLILIKKNLFKCEKGLRVCDLSLMVGKRGKVTKKKASLCQKTTHGNTGFTRNLVKILGLGSVLCSLAQIQSPPAPL